ncbi:MAG: GAF domain-containing protein [Anaerolineales bacterium]|nr:GAF domain-containing protein [Anaerolineales bacterium]MBX3038220.1 GAF domain-containing protein [Anaerolineales bacterium]
MTEHRHESEILSSQQRTAKAVTLILFVLMSLVSIYTLFFVQSEDKTIIDNIMMPCVALSAGYGYYLSRKGNHIRGIYVLLAVISIASLLYPLAADNVGWQTAIVMALISTAIANGTLPTQSAIRISIGAFVFAILIVLIELFAPGATSIPTTSASIVVTAVLAIIYLGIIFYRFRQYALQTKLIITFIALSIISVSAVGFAINRLILGELTTRVNEQLSEVANTSATSISQELISQVNLLQTLSLDASLKNTLAERTPTADLSEIERLDQSWRQAVNANNTNQLMRSVLQNELSSTLLEFKSNFPAHVEVFVTDIKGANIASTDITSDYYQADEEWWQKAYNNGRGAAFISQPIFDRSTETLSVQMAVPIFDSQNENILGILRTTVNLEILVRILELGRPGETGRTEIYLPDGRELELHLEEDGEVELEIEDAPLDIIEMLKKNQMFMDTVHDGELVLVAQSFLSTQEETPAANALQNLGWRVVTLQSRNDALETVANVSRLSQLIGLAAIALASLLAILMTQYLTRPIARLTQIAEQVSSGNLQARAEVESPDEIGTLATSFNRMTNQLSEILLNLEKRVAERTTDLEIARRQSDKRANQLLAVGELSKFVNSEQNVETLLALVTRLVSERFGFYHTGIFLLDETKQYAILQAANSEGGQAMLKRGHKLKVGESGIVGYVARFGQPRIALDVGLDAVYFNNPDLPSTRSEMALPLKLRDEVIGVLDVQSEKPGAFTEDDANTLSILADQIAIAIENARLFSQTQTTLSEVQALYRQNLQEGWKTFSREEGMVGFIQSLSGGKKITEPVGSAEIQQALNRGETMVIQPNGKSEEPAIVVPIKLRGQVIGVMRIKAPEQDKQWTTNEINLSEAVSERLSLALENARLIQESQRQVIKEQAISEITSKIGSSINLENVLQTAVEELGRSIPGSEVIIKLKEDNVNGGSG